MAHAAVLVDHEEFCNAYFSSPTNPSLNLPKPRVPKDGPFAGIPRSMGREEKLRMKFAEIVNQYNLIPGLAFRESSERPDPLYVDPTRQRVDAARYFEQDVHDKLKQEWGNQVIPVEFKVVDDPFDDKKPDRRTSADRRKMARGQCITYSELLHAVQQRATLFMLVVVCRWVRFTGWDRSGTVVTRALDQCRLSVADLEAAIKPDPPLYHHDISSGNILIYPRVVKISGGRQKLQWRGILVDWEMSKPVHKVDG